MSQGEEATILPMLNEQTAQGSRVLSDDFLVGARAPVWEKAMSAFQATGGKTVCVIDSERK